MFKWRSSSNLYYGKKRSKKWCREMREKNPYSQLNHHTTSTLITRRSFLHLTFFPLPLSLSFPFFCLFFFSPLACRIDCWVGDGYIAFFFTHFSNNYGKYDLWKVFQCWGSVTSLIFDFLTTPTLKHLTRWHFT